MLIIAFANNSSTNVKLSKTELHKILQSGGFLGKFLGPLLKTWLCLMKNVLKTAKSVLIRLGLTAAAAATDAAIHKTFFVYGRRPLNLTSLNTTLIIWMISLKLLSHLKNLLKKGIRETVINEAKEQKGGFLGMLSGTLGASLLRNLLTGKGTIITGEN